MDFGMPDEWTLHIKAPIFKEKGYTRNCSCKRAVKFLMHEMRVVERALEKRLHRIVYADEMQFGFMSERKQLMLCLS